MTDFNFLSADGSVNVTLRADFIPVASIDGSENITICDILDAATDTEKAIFAAIQKVKYSVAELRNLAVANNLKLDAYTIGKNGNPAGVALNLWTPQTFARVVNSATQITLTWVKSTGATGYVIERATNAGFSANLVTTTVGDVATLVVTGLTTATTYYFRIKAINTNGGYSAVSASINGTTS